MIVSEPMKLKVVFTCYGNNICHLANDVISSQKEIVLQARKHFISKYMVVLNVSHTQQFPCSAGNIFFYVNLRTQHRMKYQ
jgi:hypothetical protein